MMLSLFIVVILVLNGAESTLINNNLTITSLKKQMQQIVVKIASFQAKVNLNCTKHDNKTPEFIGRIVKLYTGCDQLFEDGFEKDGVFKIWLTHGYRFLSVLCNMGTVGAFSNRRGWITIQRRTNGEVNFERNWNDYLEGFGFPDEEYWIGLRNLYDLHKQRRIGNDQHNMAIRMDMADWDGVTAFSECDSFSLRREQSDYLVTSVGRNRATPGIKHPLGYIINSKFSTSDHNNNRYRDQECARTQKGGWWFGYCDHLNPNGIFSEGKELMTKSKVFFRYWHRINPNRTSIRTVSIALQ